VDAQHDAARNEALVSVLERSELAADQWAFTQPNS
jgi:hypothetical protein